MTTVADAARRPVPRGIARTGPAVLSYGFRPFFLAAGLFAILAVVLWLLALDGRLVPGGGMGALNWHAHEMLFGYATAALAGFLLTAIPNWTGRLPVAGLPLLGLFGLWLGGRLTMAVPEALGSLLSALVDSTFLPVLALIAAREVIAGRNWKNLKVLAGLLVLTSANAAFHVAVATGSDVGPAVRATVSAYVMLIVLVGGRIVPSFTRNVIAKAGGTRLPSPFGTFDKLTLVISATALAVWSIGPDSWLTALLAGTAAVLHAIRLWRWRGWQVVEEPLLVMMHVSYAFVFLGLAAIAAAAFGWIGSPSALHLLTVGGIGGMTLAVMTRASLGHTGRRTVASPTTAVAYLALLTAAVTRPFAELVSTQYHLILAVSGVAWVVAFGLFVIEYAPILCRRNDLVDRRR